MMRLLILCAFIPLPLLAEAPALPKSIDPAAIDAYMLDQVKDKGYGGLAIGILKNGKVVVAKGYGVRSLETKEPMEADTALRIGSVSKQFTCAAILLLAEDGKLSVTDKVAKYYPDLTKANDITLLDMM